MYVYYMRMVLQSATDGLLLQVVLVKAVGRVHISDPHHIQYWHFYFVCVGGGGGGGGVVNPPTHATV